ncbi:MAG: hypothetical protein SFV15_16450 [Polyangiaceae bacterium]|nr:hypothetical protein [Polyangiaceae bacterium]
MQPTRVTLVLFSVLMGSLPFGCAGSSPRSAGDPGSGGVGQAGGAQANSGGSAPKPDNAGGSGGRLSTGGQVGLGGSAIGGSSSGGSKSTGGASAAQGGAQTITGGAPAGVGGATPSEGAAGSPDFTTCDAKPPMSLEPPAVTIEGVCPANAERPTTCAEYCACWFTRCSVQTETLWPLVYSTWGQCMSACAGFADFDCKAYRVNDNPKERHCCKAIPGNKCP